MSQHHPSPPSSDRAARGGPHEEARGSNAAPPAAAPARIDDDGLPAEPERDQFARDLAEIERATATLRKAEPTLETWTALPPQLIAKPRSVWLLIGLLWISTALATLGAVVAIAALVG